MMITELLNIHVVDKQILKKALKYFIMVINTLILPNNFKNNWYEC